MKTLGPFLYYPVLVSFMINLACCSIPLDSMQNKTDKLALMAFKMGISQDPFGMLSSWNDSVHFCHWQGISCSHRHLQRVVSINLESYGLVGFISPRIGNLTFLREIVFKNNSFHGELPAEIGHLRRLRVLELSNNSFDGKIPSNLTECVDLEVLVLVSNKLTGKIPIQLGSLPKLTGLGLTNNHLTGSIPSSLGNLSALRKLSIGENILKGSVPEDLGRIKGLVFLQIGLNSLTGHIPSSLYNLSYMQSFQVQFNQLEGSLPRDIGVTLPQLTLFVVAGNRLGGTIPSSLTNASNLEGIYLSNNSFTGRVPNDLGSLQQLSLISMAFNQLGSSSDGAEDDLSFISSLTNCSNLKGLDFQYNGLRESHSLDKYSITNLSTQLTILSLRGNQIHGTLPLGIGRLVNLTFLDLSENYFTGGIPTGIGKLERLQELHLDRNKISGKIPSSIGEITSLIRLHLAGNNLYGEIPLSLANCQKLYALDLSSNNLSGNIPKQVMGLSSLTIAFNLSFNALTGSLPLEVGNLINLSELDISDNQLSGDIPETFSKCVSLSSLRLEGNLFEGQIPQGMATLRGLQYLDLSRNNFSGHIPTYLAEFRALTNLNLSFNKLDGEVPTWGLFKNATVVSVFGNYNLCGGIPEFNLPRCITQQKGTKHLVIKVVMPIIAAILCLSLVGCSLIILRRRGKLRTDLPSAEPFKNQFLRISYADIHKATQGFSESNKIGSGSYGTVYKGIVGRDEMITAIKVLNLHRKGASKSFMSECKALKDVRHRNLLKILSACSSVDFQGNDFKAIVFEFMPNGGLEKWLHPEKTQVADDQSKHLNFLQRLKIAIEVASALEYLHCRCEKIIVHSDLKPSNVLLDQEMTAHVGDFGLATIISAVSGSIVSGGGNQSSSNVIKGTIGYVAPEYGSGGNVSTQGDVYSYGILLLEMFTGRMPTDEMFKEDLTLHNFVKTCLPERAMEMVDPRLLMLDHDEDAVGGSRILEDCFISIMRIGISCSMESPAERMEMGDVVNRLHSIMDTYLKLIVHGHGGRRERR